MPVVLMLLLAGCTIHPPGERGERDAAERAGKPFVPRFEHRVAPPLPDDPSPEQLVAYALQTNADLEQQYWQWRSAIEQIPQDGTQPTNLVLSANLGFTRGHTGLGQTTISAGNDPMADVVLPPKLSVAARRALENARAAGMRFRKAQLELRAKVLSAWYDYALTAELDRMEQANRQLLVTTEIVVEARNRAGMAGLADVLKARNEVDLSDNDIAALAAHLPSQRAGLNALLNRTPDAPLAVPNHFPAPTLVTFTDADVLTSAAARNPELAALGRDVAGRQQGVSLARLQYLPDFSVNAGTDLRGIAQNLFGMVTIPILRKEAIDAAVAQADANLRAADAMLRQSRADLASQVVADLSVLRDTDRQLQLFEKIVLPRSEQEVLVARSAYESGHATLLDLLDSQRALIGVRRLIAKLHATREKRLAELDALILPQMKTDGHR